MKRFFSILLCGAGIFACTTHAATMQFGNTNRPNNGIEYNSETGYILIPFNITNNDLNTEYSQAVCNAAKPGLEALYALGSNSNTYANLEDMITNSIPASPFDKVNMYVLLDSNQDYVNLKWKIEFNADASIRIYNTYLRQYDHWVDNSNPQDYTASVTLAIGSWLYDGDGVVSNFSLVDIAPGDAIPFIVPNQTLPDAAVATTIGGSNIPAPGNYLSLRQPQTTNGTPIAWLADHNLSDDTADPDNDGFQTLEEYIAATDPTNAASFLQIGLSTNGVEFATATGRTYSVIGCGNLVSNHWNNVTNLPGTGNSETVPFGTNLFYRLEVSLD